ncbi:hypothetical protein [Neisseria sp. Ec49-e6-T10]|uniref:hypothetical protein n=1 Tax=Neisseria sp. Ec49-e6-T10 TaxID=3140744 RepID=UPI003EC0571D
MKAQYTKESLQPVIVTRLSDGSINIRYSVPPESLYYSRGINYVVEDGVMKIVMTRNNVKTDSRAMLEGSVPDDNKWKKDIVVPYKGEKVIIVYSDAEEQVYP